MTKKNEIPLKNCPFCGGSAETVTCLTGFVTVCEDCSGDPSAIELYGETKSKSQLAWNTRAAQPQPVDLDALKQETQDAVERVNPGFYSPSMIGAAIDHLASRGMIVTAQQPTEDAQRALKRIIKYLPNYGQFEDCFQSDIDLETIRAALARGLGAWGSDG